jgi:O-antigen ligase
MPHSSETLTAHGPYQGAAFESWRVPPAFLEAAFYAYLIYSIFSDVVGISIPLGGVGMLAAMVAYCFVEVDAGRQISSLRPAGLPLACGASYLIVQIAVHGEGLEATYVREFVPWMLTLVVVQALARREGFLFRCVLVTLAIGLMTLPLLKMGYYEESVFRAELDRSVGTTGGLANSNALGDWFGFCAVSLAIIAIESRRMSVRAVSLLLASGCLFVVGLTVSRGALLSVAFAVLIALRRLVKRGFVPLLSIAAFAWIAFASGMFDDIAAQYGLRGGEESGRFLVWPIAIGRWLASPLTGVGAAHAGTYVEQAGHSFTPHNGFLFIALVSGLLPLAFFVLYWIQAGLGALRSGAQRHLDARFHLPLLAYAFLTTNTSGLTFMVPWAVVTLASACAAAVPGTGRRGLAKPPLGTRPSSPRFEPWPARARGL